MDLLEVQLDGLPAPTHHYGGLSHGNIASTRHAGHVAQPRAAAHQCLAKIRQVRELGVPVAVLPPLLRPDLAALRAAGFTGEAPALVTAAAAAEPELLNIAMASAAMWTANAGTVVPANDSRDRRCHLVPANLLATPHRALEAGPRTAMLRALLAPAGVVVHDALPASPAFADEGAANHTRLWSEAGSLHCFVYGRDHGVASEDLPQRYPARQTRLAQAAIARQAGLAPERCVFIRQHPAAIDAGAFHNDVVMVGAGNRLLVHEQAWVDQAAVVADLRRRLPDLVVAEVATGELDLTGAVASYLFNSLLLTTASGWTLLAPIECRAPRPLAVLERLQREGFIDELVFVDLRQSMQGGGGPACLRLRLPLAPAAWSALAPTLGADEHRLAALEAWVARHYREHLALADLADPELARESIAAQRELAEIFQVPLTALIPPGW